MNNRFWFGLLGVLVIIGLMIHNTMVTTLSSMVLAILLLAGWWSDHALDDISYTRKFHFKRGFPGEKTAVEIRIKNNKLLPVSWLRVEDSWPGAVSPIESDGFIPGHLHGTGLISNLFSLRWFEGAVRRYELEFRKRGVYQVGPVEYTSGDAFGFFKKNIQSGPVDELVVFPELLEESMLNFIAEDPFGDSRSFQRIFEDPSRPMGVREYRPRDGFRHIHWQATAKTGDLKVKVYQPTASQQLVVCVNVQTFHRHWEGIQPEMLEQVIRVAATLIYRGFENNYQIGLISNGCVRHSDQTFRILPGRSTAHLIHMLQSLAEISPVVITPFERFLSNEIPKIPYGTNLVIVSALISSDLLETLVQLRQHSRRIIVCSLANESVDPIPGIELIQLLFNPEK